MGFRDKLRIIQRGDTFIRLYPNPGFSLDFRVFHIYWSQFRGWHAGWSQRPENWVHIIRRKVGR